MHLAALELDRVPQEDVPTASRPRVGRVTEGHDVAAVDNARERLMLLAESYRALGGLTLPTAATRRLYGADDDRRPPWSRSFDT